MIEDFWLGALVVTTVSLGLLVAIGVAVGIVAARYLRAFTAIQLHKDPIDGRFTAQVEVRPTSEVSVPVGE